MEQAFWAFCDDQLSMRADVDVLHVCADRGTSARLREVMDDVRGAGRVRTVELTEGTAPEPRYEVRLP